MKIKQLFTYCLLASTFLLASCDNETLPDGDGAGTPLPESKYPLGISFVSMSVESSEQPWDTNVPQTRVSENTTHGNSSQWTDQDRISVQIGDDNTNVGKYKVRVDGNGNVTGVDAETVMYWKNTNRQKVKGWYPADTGSDIPLNNQGNSLAYILYAETSNEVDYQTTNIELPFKHQLSKIRVILKGTKATTINDVKVYTYTACKFNPNNGTKVVGSGNQDYIPMKKNSYDNGITCWEANVMPGYKIEKFKINGTTEGSLSTTVTSEGAKVHEITITVNGFEIIAEDGSSVDPNDINKNVTIIGGTNQTLNITGSVRVTLDNVTLSCNTGAPIRIANGCSPTIIIKGTNNSLTATSGNPGIWVDGDNANVKITGGGSTNSCVKIESEAAAIGTKGGPGTSPKCGDITIENVKITATIKEAGAAAIGFGAAYGLGSNQKIGNITITNSEIEAKLTENQFFPYGAVVGGCGGGEGSYQMGDIRITTGNSSTPQNYFSKCTCGDVLVGFPSSSYNPTVNKFKIYWNGQVQSGNITK